jgi:transposase
MHLREKLSLHEISKCTGLSPNTIRKWFRKPEDDVVTPPRYRRGEVPNKLTPYHATLEYDELV